MKIKIRRYKRYFSNGNLWEKLKKYGKNMGIKGVSYVLTLYYVLQKKDVPLKEKSIIVGALGYFILPIDFIPDFLVGGYTDDIGVLIMAIKKCSDYVDDEIRNKVAVKLEEWFSLSNNIN